MADSPSASKITLSRATSLVVGNMIGSGIFLLPASLALYGSISFLGWILSGIGALLLAKVFARLSKAYPHTGGPYIYSHQGFGEFAGFLAFWSYWVSVLVTNAAIAIAFTGYFGVLFPFATSSAVMTAVVSISVIWILTYLNTKGAVLGANVQFVTTLLKILPLIAVSIIGVFFIDFKNFTAFNVSAESDLVALFSTLTLTLFALLGIESATIPADEVENPEKVIPKATIIGTIIVISIYLLSSFSIMGLIPIEDLQTSSAPFAEAANKIFGPIGMYLVTIGALISTFGALNGWILIQGQIAIAPAKNGIFPKTFGRLNNQNSPAAGLIISSIIVTFFVTSNYTKGLVEMFTFMILVGTFSICIPYLFTSLSEMMIVLKANDFDKPRFIKASIYGIPSFVFSLCAILGSPHNVVYYGFIFMILGVPVYVWSKKVHKA